MKLIFQIACAIVLAPVLFYVIVIVVIAATAFFAS